jgi:hypothetical protein
LVAVVLRLVMSPTIHTEYLSQDDEWTDERRQAREFKNHAAADAHAAFLRARGEEHVHATLKEKPITRHPVPDPNPRAVKTEPKAIKIDRYRELQCRRDEGVNE